MIEFIIKNLYKTNHTLDLQNHKLNFTITYKRIKRIIIRIRPKFEQNAYIEVSAPFGCDKQDIYNFVLQSQDWIQKSVEKVSKKMPNQLKTISINSGDEFFILGKKHFIKLFPAIEKQKVEIYGDNIIILCLEKNLNNFLFKKKLLIKFLNQYAQSVFQKSIIRCNEKAQLDFSPKLVTKYMISKWGICYTDQKKIVLSTALIYANIACIDYVVMHELTHFYCGGHKKDFYKKLESLMPNYNQKRLELKKTNIRILESNKIN